MSTEKTETLIVSGGQAGLAMSEHLGKTGGAHLVLEPMLMLLVTDYSCLRIRRLVNYSQIRNVW